MNLQTKIDGNYYINAPQNDERANRGSRTQRARGLADARREILLEFKTDLESENWVMVKNAPAAKLRKLFDISWERGHSEGFQAVAEVYAELAELVEIN